MLGDVFGVGISVLDSACPKAAFEQSTRDHYTSRPQGVSVSSTRGARLLWAGVSQMGNKKRMRSERSAHRPKDTQQSREFRI